jgi:hypothetical protein
MLFVFLCGFIAGIISIEIMLWVISKKRELMGGQEPDAE